MRCHWAHWVLDILVPREMLVEAAAAGWSVTFFPLHQLEVDWEIARNEIPWEIEIVSDWGAASLG